MMTKARLKMAEKDTKKESVSDGAKPTSICGFFLKGGKCYRANCKFSHKINTEEKCQDLKKGSDVWLDSATKPPSTYLPEVCNPVHNEKMPSSQVNSELERVGRPHQEISEEELCESLKCEMLENCTPQFCSTCQKEFSSEIDSKAHYAAKPHQRLLQMKLKVMLRKKIGEENLRKKQGDSELINSAAIASENKQIGTDEMLDEKNGIKEETRKRKGDHLDEDLCVVDSKYETVRDRRPHYVGKHHKKKLKKVEMGLIPPPPQPLNPNNYACNLCQFTANTKVHLDSHLQGSKHKSKQAQQNSCKPHYIGKPHKKKLKKVKMGLIQPPPQPLNPNNYTCSLCQLTVTSNVQLEMHLQGSKHRSKEAQQVSSNMSNYETNPVGALQERFQSRGITPQYRLVQAEGASHAPTFAFQVILGDLTATGTGSSKKQAKHVAARAMLDKLNGRVPAQDGQAPLPPVTDAANGPDAPGNTVGALQELCVKKVDSLVSSVVEKNQETGIAVEAESRSEKSIHMAEEMDDGKAKDISDLSDSMSKISSDGKPGKENMVEEMENTFSVESKESLSDTESMPVQAAVIMNENSVMIDEKMDDCEARDIPDLSDLKVRKLAGHNNTDTEFMSMQTIVMMNENTSEKSVIKDEEMDDGEAKDIPDLCDSMCNLAGYGDIIKNNELKITLNLKEKELLHPAEIVKTPTSETLQKEDIVLATENIEVKKSTKEDDEREEEASSDDDLIILDNPDSSSPRKSVQNTQNLNNAPFAESVKLCVYPLGQSESVTVSTQDYLSLAYDTFLNDIIIDFYLLYLANNVLSNSDRDKVHIFSTMFYKRLMQSPRADAKKVPDYENDATLTSAEIRHFRVASWTKNVDLFEKDMIIIPICEESHWYLLLVVKPGIIFLPFKSKERKERGEPFMIVLDSVGGRKNMAVKNIRRYLACEWIKKKRDGAELLSNLEKMGKKIDTLRPNKPEQENNSDCGIFLLQYVDKVFQNVSAFLWPFLVNSRTREWFTSEEVAGKRGEIAQLIKRLTKEQKPEEVIYPNIKFTAKGV